MMPFIPGPQNLITDVPGIRVGNASDETLKSGVTVLTADTAFVAAVDVMGGAPGTRETDCLESHNLVNEIDALVLSGGSAFGLDAASGVTDGLRAAGRGFAVGTARVPIVPAAILFDLLNGGDKNWQENPYRMLGQQAYGNVADAFDLGTVGAGTGATTANRKGGLGSASLRLANGVTVGALVAVNAYGQVVGENSGRFFAACNEIDDEFGGHGIAPASDWLHSSLFTKQQTAGLQGNTTIAIVATDAILDKPACKRMAIAAQDGMARAVVPSHTLFDGDLVFAASTRKVALDNPHQDQILLGHAASLCMARAIARGVYFATASGGDKLPTWSKKGIGD